MKAVAARTGISSHTIRAWERRYGALSPARTPTNRRLYSAEDVEKLLLMRRRGRPQRWSDRRADDRATAAPREGTPGGPGFDPIVVELHSADLKWLRATVPTPRADVRVHWENDAGKPFDLHVWAPEGVEVQVRLPRAGAATVNGEAAEAQP